MERLLPTHLEELDRGSMTPGLCKQACYDNTFFFAGVQNSQECWCGNTAPPQDKLVPTEECSSDCRGDPSQKCGGSFRMNVYMYEGVFRVSIVRFQI